MPMIDHQVPLKSKENIHRNSTLKLRRCVALFLHLIGIHFYKNKIHINKFFFSFLKIIHQYLIFSNTINIFDMLIK
jgi:hypothetical protein